MFENNAKKARAWKLTCYLMPYNIPDKYIRQLAQYIESLSDEQAECYVHIAQRWYDIRTIRKSSRIKITTNAVKLCLKLAEQDVFTFPLIEKVATKGWDTAGGTYSFSMSLLTEPPSDIYSFLSIERLIKKDVVLDIGVSQHGFLEIEIKEE